jgi:hypothetical protein
MTSESASQILSSIPNFPVSALKVGNLLRHEAHLNREHSRLLEMQPSLVGDDGMKDLQFVFSAWLSARKQHFASRASDTHHSLFGWFD